MRTTLRKLSGAAKRETVPVAAVSQKVLRLLGAGQKLGRSSSRVTHSIDDNMTPAIRSVGTPAYDHNRVVITTLATTVPSVRANRAKLTNLISTTPGIAAEISGDVDYEVPVTQKDSRVPDSI